MLQTKDSGKGFLELGKVVAVEAFLGQRQFVDVWGTLHGVGPNDVLHHIVDLVEVVAEAGQCRRHGLVDDLEVTATGQLLKLDQGKVGLDTGGVTIH